MTDDQKYIKKLTAEISKLEAKIETLIQDGVNKADAVFALQDSLADMEIRNQYLEGLPDAAAYIDLCERLADTRNWIDGRYAPIVKELYDDVPSLCSAILRENQ